MNPEFQRQLWLQFSPMRLALMPLLLLVCFLAVGLPVSTNTPAALAACGIGLFVLTVFVLGTYAAGTSVMDEVTDHTWDQQRMSAMSPWTMTWGKLFGATAYGWYGGALCLLVAIPCAWMAPREENVVFLVALGILMGIALHAFQVAVNLQLVKAKGRIARRGGGMGVLVIVLMGANPLSHLLDVGNVQWWGGTWSHSAFVLGSAALAVLCTVVGAWRSMSDVLAVRQFSWGLPTLALIATLYISGFAASDRLQVVGLTGFTICVILTYLSLLTESQTRPVWQRLVLRVRDGQWAIALQQSPQWLTMLVLTLPFALVTDMSLQNPALHIGFLADRFNVWPLSLLVLRDCLLALFFYFSPKGRRPVLAFLTVMLCLYALFPWLLTVSQSHWVLATVLPIAAQGPFQAPLALLHVAAAVLLLRWRWRTTAH